MRLAVEVVRRTREAWERGGTEVWLQGGIHPHYTGDTYLNLARANIADMGDVLAQHLEHGHHRGNGVVGRTNHDGKIAYLGADGPAGRLAIASGRARRLVPAVRAAALRV